ncbi:hypothetical protein FD755_000129 [Muntiacus reevesi]|uniref:Uncharacterized protein n=1 Tax=Muntiacus reevesi TaxID=9886 RepID=A0A5J5MZX5_MUNRE|nr:hypothetical protein FD755_000129 [Muntiacus reevesi]
MSSNLQIVTINRASFKHAKVVRSDSSAVPNGVARSPDHMINIIKDNVSKDIMGVSLGEEHHNPLQYPCLENPMDRERSLEGYITRWSRKCQRLLSHSVMSDSLWPHRLQPTRLLSRRHPNILQGTLLLLLLSRFSRVRLCAAPQMAAHQAPPSLGFSRQKHWSGLPFPPPMHESEK